MSKSKGELVSLAFSKAKISGITTQPTGNELSDAVDTLEMMMSELLDKNVQTGYNYESTPLLESESNIQSQHEQAVVSRLAALLCSDYGMEPGATLAGQARQAWTSMIGKLTIPNQIGQPRRMPRGSGNTLRSPTWSRYYASQEQPPKDSIKMVVNEVDSYNVDFSQFLGDDETIASFTLTDIEAGITINSSTINDSEDGVTIAVTANKVSIPSILITATTTLARVYPKKVWFSITEA